jgi:hypothetical protein
MRFGCNRINLRPTNADRKEWFTARPPQSGSHDLCSLTDMAPEAGAEQSRALRRAVEQGPVNKSP